MSESTGMHIGHQSLYCHCTDHLHWLCIGTNMHSCTFTHILTCFISSLPRSHPFLPSLHYSSFVKCFYYVLQRYSFLSHRHVLSRSQTHACSEWAWLVVCTSLNDIYRYPMSTCCRFDPLYGSHVEYTMSVLWQWQDNGTLSQLCKIIACYHN